MIIIDSQYHQATIPLTLCTIQGDVMATAFIVGPRFIKSTFLPDLNNDGFWVLSVPDVQEINTIKINNRLYFESKSVSEILPGQYILNTESQELIIKPYDN